MFGISSAPEMFQRVLETPGNLHILSRCKGCVNYLDNILIFAEDIETHNKRVKTVVNTLLENGLTLKKSKCIIGVEEIEFLGQKLNNKGIFPCEDKLKAIKNF